MKNLALTLALLITPVARAAALFSFVDINVNRLDWTSGTKTKSTKQDFNYIELEGGATLAWGEVYGFFDFENPGRAGDAARSAAKGSIALFIPHTPLALYGQVYNFSAMGFNEQNQVFGFEYLYTHQRGWFKPFLGFHEVVQTFYTGSNGYMAGWNLGYAFTVAQQKLLLADWHEFEFGRNARYAASNGSTVGHNGAVSLWWSTTEHLSLGFQWRYAQDKLGTPGALGAEIFTVKYGW